MSGLTVVYDACVLYPAPLCDLLMHLAVTDLYRAKWSDAIHDEWTRNVLRERPDLKAEQLQRTRNLMNAHVLDSLVAGFEPLIPNITLPDPDDRHVLAAAIHCGADVIVTFNLKDFPDDVLQPYGIRAQHPDAFLTDQLQVESSVFCAAVNRHRASLKNPRKTVAEYLQTLEAQGLAQTASGLRQFADLI